MGASDSQTPISTTSTISNPLSTISSSNNNNPPSKAFQEITTKKEMEWVVVLMGHLIQGSQNGMEYSEHLLTILRGWIEQGKSKLDPKEFRTLYINKNYSNTDFTGSYSLKKKSQNQMSLMLVSPAGLAPLNSNSNNSLALHNSHQSANPHSLGNWMASNSKIPTQSLMPTTSTASEHRSSFAHSSRDNVSATMIGGGGGGGRGGNQKFPDLLQQHFESQRDDLALTNDLIGLSFYEVSDQYRRKFLTLHTHFQFDHHPLRKLMEEYRKWMELFIKEKQGKIKQAASMF